MSADSLNDKWLKCLAQSEKIVAAYRAEAPDGFDPKDTWVAVAVVAAGAVAGVASNVMQSQTQEDINKRNVSAQEQVNAEQIAFQKQLLGDQGTPVMLPWYTGGYESQTLFPAAQQIFGETAPTAADIAQYRKIVGAEAPAFGGAQKTASDIFSGAMTNERLAAEAPVETARTQVAGAQKEGILEALSARLDAIRADRARAGYTGGGTFQQNRLLSEAIPFRQAAAGASAQANLQNAASEAAIKQLGIDTRLKSLQVPGQVAQEGVALRQIPAAAQTAAFQNALSPLAYFRRPSSGPLAISAPRSDYVASPLAAGLSSVGTGANSIANYLAMQRLSQNLYSSPDYAGAASLYSANPSMGNSAQTLNDWEAASNTAAAIGGG